MAARSENLQLQLAAATADRGRDYEGVARELASSNAAGA